MKAAELIYDWNQALPTKLLPARPVLLNDETLRDGLQSPSVRDPSIEQKLEILGLMEELGINALDLGLPGAGPRAVEHVEALAREIAGQRMKIRANCAARTHENDIRPIADIVQRTGLPIEAATFIGSSPIRRFTENWTEDFLLQTTEKAVKFATGLGLEVMYVTEDTLRPGDGKAALLDGHQLWGTRNRSLRYFRPCHSYGRVRADQICDRRGCETFGRKDSRGWARPLRPRIRGRELDGCTRGRR